MALEHRENMTREDELWERIHAMEKVMAYVGECAGVEPGDVSGLIDWADSHRVQPSNDRLSEPCKVEL